MRNGLRMAAGAAVLLVAGTVWGEGAAVPDAMGVPPPGAVKPSGWLLDWAQAAARGYTGHMPEVDDEFKRAWAADFQPRGKKLNWWEGTWSCEGGAYWFDGLVRLAFQLDDPELKALAKSRLDPVLDHMHGNAIGFCWWLDRRDPQHWAEINASSTWMVNWVAGMFARPVSAWYEATGDERAAKALRGALGGDWWVRAFGNTPTLPSGAYEAWRITGDAQIAAALKSFADRVVTNRASEAYAQLPWDGLEDTLNLKRRHHWALKLPSRHGVYTHEDLLSVFAAYRATGNRELLDCVRAWYRFLDRRARLPFGATVMDEEWGHPGPGRGTETCALAAETWTRINLLAALGEGAWGDDVERAFYNAAPSAVDRDWRNHVYFQVPNRLEECPLDRLSVGWSAQDNPSARYQSKHNPLCCTAGLNRLVPDFVQAMWLRTADGGAAAALYGPCTVDLKLRGGRFAAVERTDYPFAETVEIEVSAAPAEEMTLALRLPGWCPGMTVKVNGKTAPWTAWDGFARLRRAWRAGDRISLRLPMSPRLDMVRDLDDSRKDYAFVSAGPLLFARGFAERTANEPAEDPAVPTVNPRTLLDGAEKVVAPLAHPWNWPFDAPVKIRARDAAGRQLELMPYGCTKFRAALLELED